MKKILFMTLTFALVSLMGADAKDFFAEDTLSQSYQPHLVKGKVLYGKEKEKSTNVFVPFSRGLNQTMSEKIIYIPKGSVSIGATASYASYSVGESDDDAGYSMLFSLVSGLKGNMVTYSVAPHIDVFVGNNMSLGIRGKYSRSDLGLDVANLGVSDLSFSLADFNYIKDKYSADLSYRNFIPFGRSKVFAMIFDVRLGGEYAQTKSYNVLWDSNLSEYYNDGVYTDSYGCGLNLVPGIMAFVSDELALEVNVGVLGVNYSKTIQTTNQVQTSVMESWNTSFKINLLTVNFGLSLYILTGKNRVKWN